VQPKPARDLQVGDTFYRGYDPDQTPSRDAIHTVLRIQYVPIRDFFGGFVETVQMDAQNHLLGPAKLSLGADEVVWIVEGSAAAPPPSSPPARDRSSGSRWGRRRRT
jgi:hypothetical protein